jgi:hypothetical protein
MLRFASNFILFLFTLGPIKTIVPFVGLMSGADEYLCRSVAVRVSSA